MIMYELSVMLNCLSTHVSIIMEFIYQIATGEKTTHISCPFQSIYHAVFCGVYVQGS